MVGRDTGIDDDVGPAFGQIHHLDLGEGARPAGRGVPTERRSIGRRVGHVFHRAIQRHQAQAEEKRAARRLGRDGLTDLMEQRGQGTRPHLIAAVGERAVPGQGKEADRARANARVRASLASTALIDKVV